MSYGLISTALPSQILKIFEETIEVSPELGPEMRRTLVAGLSRKFSQGRQDRKYEEMRRLVAIAKDTSAPEDEQTAATLLLINGREDLKIIKEPLDWNGPYSVCTSFVQKWLRPVNEALREKYGQDKEVRQKVVDNALRPVEIRDRDRATTASTATPKATGKGKGKGKSSGEK